MIQDVCLFLLETIALYFIFVNVFAAFLFLLSYLNLKRFMKDNKDLPNPEDLPAVSFIIPAFNEESLITETIQTYLLLPNIEKEIIVVDDGSADRTFTLLQAMFQLRRIDTASGIFKSITHPELVVLKSTHQGKAASLNHGITHAKYDLICTMDADTIPTKKGVLSCLKAFKEDRKLIAAGGIIKVLKSHLINGNDPHPHRTNPGHLTILQNLEYLQAFICGRIGWSLLGSTTLISGAFCMAKKSAIQQIGCFTHNSITEDLDLIIRLRKHFKSSEYHFKVLPVISCHTQVPGDSQHLKEQRMRWHTGLIQTLSKNLSLNFNPEYGLMGMLAVPYLWLVEILSPLIELFAVLLITLAFFSDWINPSPVLYLLAAGLSLSVLTTLLSVYLESKYLSQGNRPQFLRTFIYSASFHLGYRQLTSYWRLAALMKSFGKSSHWGGKLRREIIHQSL